eukprot:jgi/Bigna1/81129/fgenesh1_pg.77_\
MWLQRYSKAAAKSPFSTERRPCFIKAREGPEGFGLRFMLLRQMNMQISIRKCHIVSQLQQGIAIVVALWKNMLFLVKHRNHCESQAFRSSLPPDEEWSISQQRRSTSYHIPARTSKMLWRLRNRSTRRKKRHAYHNQTNRWKESYEMRFFQAFARREDILKNKDLELQEALILFNRFLKQNENKRRTAQMAADNEKKQKKAKVHEIEDKKKEIQTLKKDYIFLIIRKVERNEKYKEFLQKVYSEYPEDFEERDHIMYRYWSLKKTHNELKAHQKKIEAETEEISRNLKEGAKAQQTLSLELNNQMAKATKKFEKILEEKSNEVAKIEHQETVEASKKMKLSTCISSVENIYKRCCTNEAMVLNKPPILSYKSEEASTLDDKVNLTVQKLKVIHRYLEDFSSIVEMWEVKKAAEKKLANKEQS